MLSVQAVTEVTEELHAAFERLVPQLSRSSPAPTPVELAEIVASPATTVFVARSDEGAVIGILTLVVYRIPTGVRARIEDVVVDQSATRQGAGEALTMAAVGAARRSGAKTVELSSRPSREAANRLYQRLGFERRETNSYRLTLPAD
jgi:ribosomal protein S18 acetylase RimI-like enzyme